MVYAQKVVTKLPADQLWTYTGPVAASRGAFIGVEEITELLKNGIVRFVILNVGSIPQWISEKDCNDFWKIEFKPHLASLEQDTCSLDDSPDNFYYQASMWKLESGVPIVVFELYH